MREGRVQLQGYIKVNEKLTSHRFCRFVEGKVNDWLQVHQLADQQPAPGYEVAFFDEDTLGEISCMVVVSWSGQIWRSWETADDPRLALNRSMENLKIEETDRFIANDSFEGSQKHG